MDEYNAEQDRSAIEKTFMDLMHLANDLSEEQQRHVREGFQNDEELTLPDLLFKGNLSSHEIRKIKILAVELLGKIKETIANLDHWTDKEETKTLVDNVIRDALYEHLPESYSDESIGEYRQQVYTFVYTHYQDVA